MIVEIDAREQELIHYFRGLTSFNQQRLMSIAGTAYENRQRALAVQEGSTPIQCRQKA
ncbi:hypothetical protein SAMN05660860_01368 [Geoalkalibacter ferrihydriticus]|uniref:Uncharacterized protein n=1 Tax=Geoalkalibacter ferrihydriticus TaxID=392333 RepID=A0A1G9N7A7_9BACT|nr:hypothetical protein [Geoalkalibacter ferrihydriticus]SDL82360.1 hypothetical protein SAMN05660860_01368 [Geoalkalibacter ferrihydriticus]